MRFSAGLILVELFGAPGAGKTTLAHAVADPQRLLSATDLLIAWRRQSTLQKCAIVAGALSDSACATGAARLAMKCPLRSGDSLVRLARLVAKSYWLRSRTGKLLLQEGLLQDLWSTFYSAGRVQPDPELLSPFLRTIYDGVDVRIVHLEVDPQTAFSRITNRRNGKSRFDQLPERALWRKLLETAQLSSNIAEAARTAGLRVETLDGSAPLATLACQLRSIVVAAGRPTT